MMRITNSMMTTNTKNNINLNKVNEDNINTQVATGQKISRPSDDPVVAIRALRFNTTISQLNQYYDKNIPDAEHWLNVTETALKQTDQMYDDIISNLTTGASDTNTASDRQKILESLKGLRDEFYATGNADYAGRTVFTGYRTGESLSFLSTDNEVKNNCEYKIFETVEKENVGTVTRITTGDSENDIESLEVGRVRLSYENLNQSDGDTITVNDKSGTAVLTAEAKSIVGLTDAQIDQLYKDAAEGGKTYLIVETGEIITAKENISDVTDAIKDGQASVTYSKNSWKTGEPKPEHYFACIKDGVKYNYDEAGEPDFKNQSIEIEVSYNQKITINTNANEVYKQSIGREIDDYLRTTQDVIDVESRIEDLKKELSKAATEADKEAVQKKLDAANKEYSLKKDQMQKKFSEGIDIFKKYSDENNVVIADIGSMSQRLKITKERVSDQLESFEELADDNININLTDAAIDLSNAGLALQAAQLAASKIAKQTLLDYL